MSAARRYLHSVDEIARMLDERAEQIAAELFPAGRRSGPEWRVGSIAGEPGQSLGIRMTGPKRGVWMDFNAGIGGDMLELVARARYGGDRGQALRWARAFLGLSEAAAPAGVTPPPPPPRVPADEVSRDFAGKARALWFGGHPIGGTPAAAYLAGRGISLARLGRLPGALRFRPDVYCSERRVTAPAMLAAILRGGTMIGCHRTFLAPRPSGGWGKAPIQAPKKIIGQVGGGFIPVWRGKSGKALRDAPADDTLAVCEGIEDALTIALHTPEWRVVAAVSIGNLAKLSLPDRFADIVCCWDRDGDNPASVAAREATVTRLLNEGRSVRQVAPPEGFKDFNAWHMAECADTPATMGAAP
jgi:hypothetical protein